MADKKKGGAWGNWARNRRDSAERRFEQAESGEGNWFSRLVHFVLFWVCGGWLIQLLIKQLNGSAFGREREEDEIDELNEQLSAKTAFFHPGAYASILVRTIGVPVLGICALLFVFWLMVGAPS